MTDETNTNEHTHTEPAHCPECGEPTQLLSISPRMLMDIAETHGTPADARSALWYAAIVLEATQAMINNLSASLRYQCETNDQLYAVMQAMVYEGFGRVFIPDAVIATARPNDPADKVTPELGVGGRTLTITREAFEAWRDRVRAWEPDDQTPFPRADEGLGATVTQATTQRPANPPDPTVTAGRHVPADVAENNPWVTTDLGFQVFPVPEPDPDDDPTGLPLVSAASVIPDLMANLATSVEEAKASRARLEDSRTVDPETQGAELDLSGDGQQNYVAEITTVFLAPTDECDDQYCPFWEELGRHTLRDHANADRRPEGQ